MKRIKTIRRIGDSIGVIFNKEEKRIFGLKINDLVEISIEKKEEVQK